MDTSERKNFRDLVPIDISRLDEEWLAHPVIYHEIVEECERAEIRSKKANDTLERVKAELDMNIRKDPKGYGVPINLQGKTTEGAVASAVLSHPEYLQAKEDAFKAEVVLTSLRNDLRTMDHRKAALEHLVRLHGQNYFASPQVPHEVDPERIRAMQSEFRMAVVKDKRRRRYRNRKDGSDVTT